MRRDHDELREEIRQEKVKALFEKLKGSKDIDIDLALYKCFVTCDLFALNRKKQQQQKNLVDSIIKERQNDKGSNTFVIFHVHIPCT